MNDEFQPDVEEAPAAEDAGEPEAEAPEVDVEDEVPEDLGELMAQELARAGAEASDAPEHWSAEDKALFASLPTESREKVKAWRTQIERGAQQKFEAAAAARKEIEELEQVFAPLAPGMKVQGVNRAAVVRSMLTAMQQINQDPASAMLNLAEHTRRLATGPGQAAEIARKVAAALGVDAGAVAHQRGQAADPVAQRMAALEARIADQDRTQQAAHQQQIYQAVSAAERAIQDFASAPAVYS